MADHPLGGITGRSSLQLLVLELSVGPAPGQELPTLRHV